jgi:hypothetical protein
MALDVGKFGPKSDKIGAHRGAFVYQEPFKKDSSIASRVINEVVLVEEFCELRHNGVLRSFLSLCSGIARDQSVYRRIQYRCYSACILMLPGGAQQRSASPSFQGIATTGVLHQLGRSRRSVVAPAFFLLLFHRSAWKWNSRNSIFRILHRTSSQSHKELAPRRIRAC